MIDEDRQNTATFRNAQIDVADIPSSDAVVFKPLEVKYRDISMWFTSCVLAVLLIAGIVVYYMLDLDLPVIVIALVVVCLLITFGAILLITYKQHAYRGYALRQHDIIYKSGVIFRSITTLPFKRVQHCEVEQGPIDRRFGLAALSIFTAGGSASDLEIHGLTFESAMSMKSYITKVIGDSDEEE